MKTKLSNERIKELMNEKVKSVEVQECKVLGENIRGEFE